MKMALKQEKKYDMGVIVGRFQVPELHDAHRDLIQLVCDEHSKVLIVLGLSPLPGTRENPLDFQARKQMLLAEFPNVDVLFIKDVNNDMLWSKRLDDLVGGTLTPSQTAVLYGGRDSFITHYHGRHDTRELEQDVWVSGTQIRNEVSRAATRATSDFRAGAAWQAFNRYPTAFATVDVAIFNEDETKLLLGRKSHETKFRLIGGFADPGSPSYEADARREVQEETGIGITDPVYVGSTIVDDWRYRREQDKIKTLLFRAKHQFGSPRAADDIEELRWFARSDLVTDWMLLVVETHWPLVHMLIPNTDRK